MSVTVNKLDYIFKKLLNEAKLKKNETIEISDEEYENIYGGNDSGNQGGNNDEPIVDPVNPNEPIVDPSEEDDHDYSQDYLTFEALEDTKFLFMGNDLQYSLDNGSTWTTLVANTYTETIYTGNKIIWKQEGLIPSSIGIGNFVSSYKKKFNIYGNIMSLLYGDNFKNKIILEKHFIFRQLFSGSNVINSKNLILPSLVLSEYCYSNMFQNCVSLITAPYLPATTLSDFCYSGMFEGCTSLISAPELPATTLAQSCYSYMFAWCSSLTTAPELPATTLASGCYNSIFFNCTSLINAPELQVIILHSCDNMFSYCSSLNYIKCLTKKINGNYDWTNCVSDSGTFVKLQGVEFQIGSSGIPQGWTVQELDPDTGEIVNEYIAE